jgi:DNA mismatch repair ATPase MutS
MKQYETIIEKYDKYGEFYKDIKDNREKLEDFLNVIKNIPKKCLTVKNIFKIGKIMKNFYKIYDSEELDGILNFSFGFNGYLDNLKGLEKNKNKLNFTKFVKDQKKTKLRMKNVFHPSIKNPIKNSINLNKNRIITGPNAAGKTTILKATILNTIFSQQIGMGYYKKCELSPFNYIHCYINIPDTSGRDSLFQAEARRCKDILDIIRDNPGKKHFCVFDELYSGTNPYEAISSAYGYLKYIIKNENVKFLLTTHFINLCKLLEKEKYIENNHMHTDIKEDVPTYHYKIMKGISNVKGGITVLKELDYPSEIITSSRNIIDTLN